MEMARDSGEELGDLLRRYRTESGLTQEELAERAAISARTVSDIERGLRSMVYRETARRLADALDLEAPYRGAFDRAARRGSARGAAAVTRYGNRPRARDCGGTSRCRSSSRSSTRAPCISVAPRSCPTP